MGGGGSRRVKVDMVRVNKGSRHEWREPGYDEMGGRKEKEVEVRGKKKWRVVARHGYQGRETEQLEGGGRKRMAADAAG